MNITYREATKEDINTLVGLRLEYLKEDRGFLVDEETEKISKQLLGYFEENIGKSCIAIIAEEGKTAVATAFLAIAEKPANPNFITGKVGTVLNVYTKPEFRKQGISTYILTLLIEKAKESNVSKLELSATEMGKNLYLKLGFVEKQSKYTDMQLRLM